MNARGGSAFLAAGALVVFASTPARAANATPCRLSAPEGRDSLSAEWRSAVASLEREVSVSLPSTCQGVELRLTFEGDTVRVSASASDGREASRLVSDPAGLSAVAFGLLAMAPREPESRPAEPLELPPAPEPAPLPPVIAPFDQALRVSVSAAAGTRGGVPTDVVMADFEGRADLSVHRWLVSLGARVSPVSLSSRLSYDEDAYVEAAIGLGFGRELRLGNSAFEVSAGTGLAYIWMENDAKNLAVEHAQIRFGAVGRWAYPVARRLRSIVVLDAEVAPSGLANTPAPAGLAPYPGFTLGLRFGAEVAL